MQGLNNHSLHFSFVYFTGLVGISEMYYIFKYHTDLGIKNGLKTEVSKPVVLHKNIFLNFLAKGFELKITIILTKLSKK